MSQKVQKKMVMFVNVVVVILVASLCGGCSHGLTVTNSEEYNVLPTTAARQSIKIGVSSSNLNDSEKSKYVTAIVESLQKNSNIERVIFPFSKENHGDMIDAIVDVTVSPRYDGMGSNFFVNFPGFLIFAPAIWGYGYTADIETNAVITVAKSRKSQQITIPTKYEFRQAEIDRTWTEIGWLEVGIIPLIGGIVFTNYDTDVTNEFIKNVSPSYGSYVAAKIVKTSYENLGIQ